MAEKMTPKQARQWVNLEAALVMIIPGLLIVLFLAALIFTHPEQIRKEEACIAKGGKMTKIGCVDRKVLL